MSFLGRPFGHGALRPGQRVLVHGVAGGGVFAVQLARWRGAHVTTTSCGSWAPTR